MLVEDTEKFCAWCLKEFCRKDEKTPKDKIGETIMMAPAVGGYTTPGMGLNQVRLAYVLNKIFCGRCFCWRRRWSGTRNRECYQWERFFGGSIFGCLLVLLNLGCDGWGFVYRKSGFFVVDIGVL